jgi:glycosyltransferase involved in cell wall biosynthesis
MIPQQDGIDDALVSVVVPVFNGARFLAEALASVRAQTYTRLELIVVDDGSTDESAAIVRAVGRGAVHYVHQRTAGTAAARNHGVALSRGGLLAFLDQDDVWSADKLALQVDALRGDPALDMVFGMITQFYSSERGSIGSLGRPLVGCLPSALLVRRSAFSRVGPFDPTWRIAEWADWYHRAVGLGLQSRVLPEIVARRRVHAQNKGVVLRSLRGEYVRMLKAGLDRRRALLGTR